MKNTPFPQAQTLDSRGVLHEWHVPVHNPPRGLNSVDKTLKSFGDSRYGLLARRLPNRAIQPLSRFEAGNLSGTCGVAATTAVDHLHAEIPAVRNASARNPVRRDGAVSGPGKMRAIDRSRLSGSIVCSRETGAGHKT
jgi:hypothetical protein